MLLLRPNFSTSTKGLTNIVVKSRHYTLDMANDHTRQIHSLPYCTDGTVTAGELTALAT